MKKYVLVDLTTNQIVNHILLEDGAEWAPPPGQVAVQHDTAGIGWSYDGSVFTAPPPPPIDWRPLAQSALDKSDVTVLRCVEAGVALPPEWATYRQGLRDIIAGEATGPLPVRPDYPAGT